jgi:GNAT superfamily N-acetyltransferase
MHFRSAAGRDFKPLCELAFKSKGYWGYSAEFMARWKAAFSLTPEECDSGLTGAVEHEGKLVGFYRLQGKAPQGKLLSLFVSPEHIGKGVGRMLFEQAKLQAQKVGMTSLIIESDPNAKDFYTRLGAVVTGTKKSVLWPGLELPVLTVSLK